MRVRPSKRPPTDKQRFTGGQTIPVAPANPYVFPAPTRGWVLNENLAAPSTASARILDNWIVTTTGARVRGGAKRHATVASSAPVVSMFGYKTGAVDLLFAASASAVYDISTPVSTDTIPTAAFSGQTSGYYSAEQFGTAGGDYLYAVNGTDSPRLFDGTTWTAITGASSPAITGVTTSELSHVWSFANRLFFVRKDTMESWYLPVDSIGGAAASFSLAGVFKKGGALLFGATWSLDAGDGLDDKCVFVSTEGEVAVYEGTNPGSAADWRKVGVYQITRPLGQNGTMQAGGDLVIATETGLVPVSEAIKRDVAALSLGAVSRNIEPYWQKQAMDYDDHPWEIKKWPSKNIMVVSQPGTSTCLVANLQSGAWSRITGWDTRCLGFRAGKCYFGTDQGRVFEMDSTGADDGAIYTCAFLGQHDPMGMPGVQKTIIQMRPVFQTGSGINPKLSARTNFNETLSNAPGAVVQTGTAGWDISLWDAGLWDEAVSNSGVAAEDSRWVAIGRTGYTIAPELQLTFGGVVTPDVELVSIDATYRTGAMVA